MSKADSSARAWGNIVTCHLVGNCDESVAVLISAMGYLGRHQRIELVK